MLDKGFEPPVRRRVRKGITTFPDSCRAKAGRQVFEGSESRFWQPPSLPASLVLRVEHEEDEGGGVG